MDKLIAKRKAKKQDDTTNTPPANPDNNQVPPAKPAEGGKGDEPDEDVGSIIAKALKFRQKAPKKAEPTPPEPPKTPEPPAEPPKEPGAKAKTIVKKPKPAAPAPDAVLIATQAATAATNAAIAALKPTTPPVKPAEDIESQLHADDRKEYEVAKYLAERDPRYKDAPATILSHVKQVDQYVRRWEQLNPGKAFDKEDEEHDDFYAKFQKPWSESEYEDIKLEMAYEKLHAKKAAAVEPEIQKLKAENARLALKPTIDQTYGYVAGLLAKSIMPTAEFKEGWFDKLAETDPITTEALSQTIVNLKPFVEAAVQIDDPEGRVPFDANNEHHQAWLDFLQEKESQFVGAEYDGKQFATRREYAAMTKAQRARHWYLDRETLVTEMVKDTAAAVAKNVESEKKRQERIALAMGYVPKAATNGSPNSAVPPKTGNPTTPTLTNGSTPKPDSPSVGSGPKIDQVPQGGDRGMNGLLAATGKILFNR